MAGVCLRGTYRIYGDSVIEINDFGRKKVGFDGPVDHWMGVASRRSASQLQRLTYLFVDSPNRLFWERVQNCLRISKEFNWNQFEKI